MRPEELAEELRLAAWRVWSEATEEQRHAIVVDAARVQDWRGSLRSWRSNVSKWLSPDRAHPLPAFALLLIARHVGREEFTGLILRAVLLHRRRPLRAGARQRRLQRHTVGEPA
jgi:hypothetical protein